MLLVAVLALMGCQSTEPVATPTATRTPIVPTATHTPLPTSTPTATPTATPTPTPTLPPGLAFPPDAVRAVSCPISTSDLFYLRDGRIWVCLAEGGQAAELGFAGDANGGPVAAYDVSADGRYIVAVTVSNEAWLLDRAVQQFTRLPTSGRLLNGDRATVAFADEGRSLTYLAWGVQIGSGPTQASDGSAALLSMAILTPTLRQRELASCLASAAAPCLGFQVAPDGRTLAYADGQGIWLLPDPVGETPRLLAAQSVQAVTPHSWSPDGAWLLLEAVAQGDQATSPAFVLISAAAEDQTLGPLLPLCEAGCRATATWGSSSSGPQLWLAWDEGRQGCIASLDPNVSGIPVQPVRPAGAICEVQGLALHPGSPLVGPAAAALGGLAVFHQDAAQGIASGIYVMTTQAELRGVALLPDAGGSVTWSPDGGTFLYTVQDGTPTYIGAVPYGVLWDATELLQGARHYVWRGRPQD